MDDDIDQWLDADDPVAPGFGDDAWGPDPGPGRPRWMPTAVIGTVLLLGAVSVVALQVGGAPGETAVASAAPTSPTTPPAAAAGPGTATPTSSPAPWDDRPDAGEPTTEGLWGIGSDPGGLALGDPGRVAGAIAALRTHLTRDAPGRGTYLEWATVVSLDQLHPDGTDPASQAWLATADAVLLTGDGAGYDTVVRQRWSVPVDGDGDALGLPWPVSAASPMELTQPEPPAGAHRVDEVAAALTAAGWIAPGVIAADPHPTLGDVVVALVTAQPDPDGPDPDEPDRDETDRDETDRDETDPALESAPLTQAAPLLVWLREIDGRLELAGAHR